MNKRLEAKRTIITGGASGIGLATTLKFLQEGAKVCIWDINNDKWEEALEHHPELKNKAHFQQIDITNESACKEGAKESVKYMGGIDVLINNAGVTRDASLKDLEKSDWQRVIDVNLTGVYLVTRACIEYLEKSKSGRVINTSSVVSLLGNYAQTNYVTSKAGVLGMTKVWAREFGPMGITVNAVSPGFINTEMVKNNPTDIVEMLLEKIPLGRIGEPAEVANVYAFLASDEASFINGANIPVDGALII